MKKIGHILTGWGKAFGFIAVSSAEAKLSELRLSICNGCPLAEKSNVLKLVNGHAKYESQLYCTKCKCPSEEKSLVVDEKCPVGKW